MMYYSDFKYYFVDKHDLDLLFKTYRKITQFDPEAIVGHKIISKDQKYIAIRRSTLTSKDYVKKEFEKFLLKEIEFHEDYKNN